MSSIFGNIIKVSIFGQSHSPAIGVTIDGLPPGLKIDLDELYTFLQRRAPGGNAHSTQRTEADIPEIISGLVDNTTCGSPLTAIIRNNDIKSSDYEQFREIPRPSHSDYSAFKKYGRYHDIRGGGAFSGRLTAPLCTAGGICLQLLKQKGIKIAAHIMQIGEIINLNFDTVDAIENQFEILESAVKNGYFPVLDSFMGEQMKMAMEEAKNEGDSLGGIIECAAIGVPAGLGEPMFSGMENRLAAIVFGIPAVRGIEFGNGFFASQIKGSENNDPFIIKDGEVKTLTNNHGGILGGITTGMPLLFRAAFKPTPSIYREQNSVNLSEMKETNLTITGRHDPCIVPRAVPCVEAAAAIAIYDALLESYRYN